MPENPGFTVDGAGSRAEFRDEVKLADDAIQTGTSNLQVKDGAAIQIGAGLLVGVTGSGTGLATVTGQNSLMEVVAGSSVPMAFNNTQSNVVKVADGGTLRLLGGTTAADVYGLVMPGVLQVEAGGYLEMLASAAAAPEVVLNKSSADSQVKIMDGGTFRSAQGKITTHDLDFAAGSEYLVYVDQAQADSLALDAVNLTIANGALLSPVISDHSYYKLGVAEEYNIIEADLSASLSGDFSLAQQSLVLSSSFRWDTPASNQYQGILTLTREKSYADAFREAGVHQNGLAPAEVLDRILANAPSDQSALLGDTFARLDGISELREMFRAGALYRADVHPASFVNSLADARLFQRQLWGRLDASEDWSPEAAVSGQGLAPASGDDHSGSSANFWAGTFGARSRLESGAGDLAGKYNQYGFALGQDWACGPARLGLAAGYIQGRSDYDGGFGRDQADALNLGLYGRIRDGGLRFDFNAGYTAAWRELRRDIYGGRATAKFRDDIWTAGLRAGYDYYVTPAVRLGPEAGIVVSHLRRGAGGESGQGQALYGWEKENLTIAEIPVGLTIESIHHIGEASVQPKFGAHYVARVGRDRYVSDLYFRGLDDSNFKNVSAGQRSGRAELSAGLGVSSGSGLSVDVTGRVSFAGGWREQSATARIMWAF